MDSTGTVTVGGVELRLHAGPERERPSGVQTVLCLHETGGTSASWRPLADELEGSGLSFIRYDRRGWGGSGEPVPYTRTTVGEQSQEALGLLDTLGIERAVLVGAGLGAVAALDLALREPSRASGVIALEPPLLALVEGATEGLSADVEALREAAEEAEPGQGREAAVDLFLAGELPFLAPGSERLSRREALGGGDGREARRRPASLFAEFGAVPGWSLPFEELAGMSMPLALVIGAATPDPLRLAGEALCFHAPTARLVELEDEDPLSGPSLASVLPL